MWEYAVRQSIAQCSKSQIARAQCINDADGPFNRTQPHWCCGHNKLDKGSYIKCASCWSVLTRRRLLFKCALRTDRKFSAGGIYWRSWLAIKHLYRPSAEGSAPARREIKLSAKCISSLLWAVELVGVLLRNGTLSNYIVWYRSQDRSYLWTGKSRRESLLSTDYIAHSGETERNSMAEFCDT